MCGRRLGQALGKSNAIAAGSAVGPSPSLLRALWRLTTIDHYCSQPHQPPYFHDARIRRTKRTDQNGRGFAPARNGFTSTAQWTQRAPMLNQGERNFPARILTCGGTNRFGALGMLERTRRQVIESRRFVEARAKNTVTRTDRNCRLGAIAGGRGNREVRPRQA